MIATASSYSRAQPPPRTVAKPLTEHPDAGAKKPGELWAAVGEAVVLP